MAKNIQRLAVAVFVMLATAGVWLYAGSVRLVNNYYPSICRVEVMKGLDAPDRGTLETYTNVARGTVTSAEGRLCFRRSADPANCSTQLTEWRCADKGTSGTLDFNLY